MADDLMVAADREPQFIGEIGFAPAFTVELEYAERRVETTPHGKRILKPITGGTVSGRIEGTVYPHGGGEFSLMRADGVTDISGHVLLRDGKGEWIYLHSVGYRRPDGYYRVTSWVDADVRGNHDWVLGLFFVGSGTERADGRGITIVYTEVL